MHTGYHTIGGLVFGGASIHSFSSDLLECEWLVLPSNICKLSFFGGVFGFRVVVVFFNILQRIGKNKT